MSTLSSTRHALALAALAFSIILIVGYGSDLLLEHYRRWMISDDLILGAVAAIVVYYYDKQRTGFLQEKLRVIRDMNAYVRNELQIIYASAEQPEKTRVTTMQRSVERIDWALREILPGRDMLARNPPTEIRERALEKIERSG